MKNTFFHFHAYPLIFYLPLFLFSTFLYLFLSLFPERRQAPGGGWTRPFFGVTRAPSAVQNVNSSASRQVQTSRADWKKPRGRFCLLWANAGSIVKMNNLLNHNCLLTAPSLFTFRLLNTLGGVPGCQPFTDLPLLSEPVIFPAPSLLSTRDIFDLFCQVRVKLQLFCDDFINSQLIDSK